MSAPNTTRLETVLSSLMHGHTVTYSSGLSALHAMFIHFNPKVVAIAKGKGYHGTHGVLAIHQRLSGVKIVDLFDEAAWDESGLEKEMSSMWNHHLIPQGRHLTSYTMQKRPTPGELT